MMQNYGFTDHGLPYAWGLGSVGFHLHSPVESPSWAERNRRGRPLMGRTKPTRKIIDDIAELADGENRRCIRRIAGLDSQSRCDHGTEKVRQHFSLVG
jgi:hypothetical protein